MPKSYHFANMLIDPQQVFLSRRYVYAMVNLKPICVGHVLVCPTRVVKKFSDLTELETLELFMTAQEICQKFESSYSISIQDGKEAG